MATVEDHGTHVRTEHAVLDIGGDIGALIIYTRPEMCSEEIEISPALPGAARVHNQVHERRANDQPVFAAIYPQLEAGDYDVWGEGPEPVAAVSVHGGEIATLDWR